ncbi:MAG: ATP-binding cassette domain-containing protein [Paracoccaceae bacterium]|nr:ATP-binding cassette domain-containing protein [Paracoccaceae bacterium]
MAFIHAAKLAALLGLFSVPAVWGSYAAYELGLYLVYGMVGQGIALCWGRAGFLPLGQALFFGIGAYLAGGALTTFGSGWLVLLPMLVAAILIPALLASLVGALVFERQVGSGPYFSLITLALAMLGFQLANSMEWLTGGFNGLSGIPDLLPGVDRFDGLYYVIVGFLGMTTFGLGYLLRTPFGQLLLAISQNEMRLQLFGFRTGVLKACTFAVSAGVAGLAGALYAPHQGIVTPQAVGFLLSAEFVIWTAVGGRAGLAGPVLGAVAIGFLASGLRDTLPYWEAIVALVFIGVVLQWPTGIAGMIQSGWQLWGPDSRHQPAPMRDIALPMPPRRRTPVLQFEDVTVKVGSATILENLSVSIEPRSINCVIGPNGAGKTSALNAMTGSLPITSGHIRWGQRRLQGLRPYAVSALRVGRKLQVPSIFSGMTIGQNLDIALWANRIGLLERLTMTPYRWRTSVLSALEDRFPFLRDGFRMSGELSVGQRQMLDFALTVASEPELVLLDEPCAGLSVEETGRMTEAISELIAELDATGIVIEHDIDVVERLSDRVHVLHQGQLLASGTMAEIRQDPHVQAVYAGGSKV